MQSQSATKKTIKLPFTKCGFGEGGVCRDTRSLRRRACPVSTKAYPITRKCRWQF